MTARTRRWVLAGAVALLAVLSLACIKLGGQETVVTPVVSTPTPLPPTATPLPPTPTPQPEAKPQILDVRLCRGLTDDERPFGETNTYSELDPFVVSVKVADFKPENVVRAHWYQDDAIIGLTERDNAVGDTYLGMTLEPETRWIPGNYVLEVSLDGDVKETRDFAVIGMAGLPGVPGDKGGGEPGAGEATAERKLYREDDLGFSMEYPANWSVDAGGSAVEFRHPRDKAAALVVVNDEPAATAEGEARAVFDRLAQRLSDVQETSAKPQEGGWHGIFFTYNDDGTDVVAVLLSKVAGSRGYSLIFAAVRDQWENIVPTFQEMWVSFEHAAGSAAGGGISGREVSIEGLVRDGDTGRGIPNATFVILKEGVTVDKFVDSGNDETLIYDLALSGPDGTFKMSVPVKRGATYWVFAVSNGYVPVVDQMSIPEDASSPWTVRVTMQKE